MDDDAEVPETILVPVKGHVKMTLPSSAEQAAFISELKVESANINRGQYTAFEKVTFVDWMMRGRARFLKKPNV